MASPSDTSGSKQRGGRKWRPGESGNLAGRPKGSGLSGELRAAIRARAGDIVAAMVERAVQGDVQAGKALLDKCLPSLRPESVAVELPKLARGTLAERAESIMQAVGSGELPPSTAGELVGALATLAKVQEVSELESRIAALEEVQNGR